MRLRNEYNKQMVVDNTCGGDCNSTCHNNIWRSKLMGLANFIRRLIMTNWVVIFFVAVFALMIGFMEAGRTDLIDWEKIAKQTSLELQNNDWIERTELRNEGLNFEDGMEIQDSLWDVIKIIQLLEDKYYILPKNKWEEHSLDRGNFESDYNIFGGTIYLKRLKPSNLEFH